MKAPFFGVTAIIGIVVVTLFFLMTQESQARPAMPEIEQAQYSLYKLQYSNDNKVWYDLIRIENGNVSENMKYLRRQGNFPYLRYWYSYIDEEGVKRVQYIPLTIGDNT